MRFARILMVVITFSPLLAMADDVIRVSVLETYRPTSIVIESADHDVDFFLDADETPILRLQRASKATITAKEGDLIVEANGASYTLSSVRIRAMQAAPFHVEVPRSHRSTVRRSYPGLLIVQPQQRNLQLVNYVDLETYVASVITHEYGFEDLEGAKAMAVAIRTYALYRKQAENDTAFDQVDHTGSQVYQGVASIMPIARQAAEATRGQVLSYDGALIEAVYSAANGGMTASNDEIWVGMPRPYLRRQKDPHDQSPHDAWSSHVPRDELLRLLSSRIGSDVRGIQAITKRKRGRVTSMRLLLERKRERLIPAIQFRQWVTDAFGHEALKSTWFSVRRKGNTYHFEGRGFGHGVGLSQWGTLKMAQKGHAYDRILAFYYPKTSLQHLEDIGSARIVDVKASPQSVQVEREAPQRPKKRRVGW